MRKKRSGTFAASPVVFLALVFLIVLLPSPVSSPWNRPGESPATISSAQSSALTPSTSASPEPVSPAGETDRPSPGATAPSSGATAPSPGATAPSQANQTSSWPNGEPSGQPIIWPKSDPLADLGLTALDRNLPDPRKLDIPDSIRPYTLPIIKGLSTSWIPARGLAATPGYTGPVCYLTFDDGPSLSRTPQILAILKAYGIKATFFVIGRNITPPLYPVVWRTQLEGHAIGNHTYDHANGSQSLLHFRHSVALTSELVQRIAGYRPTLFRFPGGSSGFAARKAFRAEGFDWLSDNGYQFFDWNSSTGDGNAKAGYSATQLVNNACSTIPIIRGSGHDIIVLAHDSSYSRNEPHNDITGALPLLIRKIADRGYRFGVLSADGFTAQFVN